MSNEAIDSFRNPIEVFRNLATKSAIRTAIKIRGSVPKEDDNHFAKEIEAFGYLLEKINLAKVENQKEIYNDLHEDVKQFFLALKITEMLTLGDWSVNRPDKEISEGMGTVPLQEVESLLLQFYQENKLISDDPTKNQQKLVHLHAGCGNGALLKELRESKTEPFKNGNKNSDYFEEVGYADRIYFSLGDFISQFVREEKKSDPIKEFISIITTLILRSHQKANECESFQGFEDKLKALPNNLNLLPDILANPHILKDIETVLKKGTYVADREFLEEGEQKITPECFALLQQYFKSPEKFIQKYFDRDLWPGSQNDLNKKINIETDGVIPGDFTSMEDAEEGLPNGKTIDMCHSFRSSSHLNAAGYKTFLKSICRRMKDGGIMLDDGIRQSYSRHYRLEEVLELKKELGDDFEFHFIVDDNNEPKSLFIQRALKKGNRKIFFSQKYGEKLLAGKKTKLMTVEDYVNRVDQRSFTINSIRQHVSEMVSGNISRNLNVSVVAKARRMKEKQRDFKVLLDAINAIVSESVADMAASLTGEVPKRSLDELISMMATNKAQVKECYARGPVLFEERKKNHGTWNEGIPEPGSIEFEQMQTLLQDSLCCMKEILGEEPIQLFEFENDQHGECFTNAKMRELLQLLLGDYYNDLIKIHTVNLSRRDYPPVPTQGISLFGGALDNTFDPDGKAFIGEFLTDLVRQIANEEPLRAYGICFGYQAILDAVTMIRSVGSKTERGNLQCGPFPFRISDSPTFSYLRRFVGINTAFVLTRECYVNPCVTNVQHEVMANQNGVRISKNGVQPYPPGAMVIENGGAMGIQFHPELSWLDDAALVRAFTVSTVAGLSQLVAEAVQMINHGLDPKTDKLLGSGISGEIKGNPGPYFFGLSLLKLANGLLKQLEAGKTQTKKVVYH